MVRTLGCGVSSAQRADPSYFPAIAETARAKPPGNALCFTGNFVAQFSVASTAVEAHLRNKSPIRPLPLDTLPSLQ